MYKYTFTNPQVYKNHLQNDKLIIQIIYKTTKINRIQGHTGYMMKTLLN